MNKLTCEMCGSNDLIKQDGVFVCQNCGCKYSMEDAKKMMVDGTVNVQGTVTIDNTAFIKKSLDNARRALQKTDWEEVEKYYNKVEEYEPHNIEAIFFSSFGKTMLSLYDQDIFKRKQKFNVFIKSISVIDDYYEIEKAEELKSIIEKMSEQLIVMFKTPFLCNYEINDFGIRTDNSALTGIMFANVEIQFIESLQNIIKKDEREYLYKILVTHLTRCVENQLIDDKLRTFYEKTLFKILEKLKQYDSNYDPTLKQKTQEKSIINENNKILAKRYKENEEYGALIAIFAIIFMVILIVFSS